MAAAICGPNALEGIELEFSTYFGGSFGDQALAAAIGPDGSIYIAGQTREMTPQPGSLAAGGGDFDVFVLRLSGDGTEILFNAVFGGSAQDRPTAIAVDGAGAAYVAGSTFSADFPVTAGAAQAAFGGGTRDAFVIKLNPDGSALEQATFLGGSAFDDASALTLDAERGLFVAGVTGSSDFPATPESFQTSLLGSQRAAFLARLSTSGSVWEAATLLGASRRDEALALQLDPEEGIWISGYTTSPDFPTTSGALQRELAGPDDIFLARMSSDGRRLLASTLLGGTTCVSPFVGGPCEQAPAMAVTSASVVLAGHTLAPDFPIPATAAQRRWRGGAAFGDGFVASFDRSSLALEGASFLGGALDDRATGLAVNVRGEILVVGQTGSENFAAPLGDAGKDDAFVARLSPLGDELLEAIVFGGAESDRALAVAAAGRQSVVLAGDTSSPDLPVTPGVVQSDYGSLSTESGDGFIAKFRFALEPFFRATGVVNAASLAAGPLAPGEIISVFGDALGPERAAGATFENGVAETRLADTRVLVNGIEAPLLFVSEQQVNAIVPFAAGGLGVAALQVEWEGRLSEPAALGFAATAPGLFAWGDRAAALNEDGTINSTENPAQRGSIVVLYGAGAGRTSPPSIDGSVVSPPLPRPIAEIGATIGNTTAEILYAGAAPGLVAGIVQLNLRIPELAPAGESIEVRFRAGERWSQPDVRLAIE